MGYGSQAGCGAECKAGKGRSKTLSYHEYGDMITSQKVKGVCEVIDHIEARQITKSLLMIHSYLCLGQSF
ncbi:hypothetical protein MTR_1g069280 [Medicago truncatula]|uniref:Uncharacterized protein n=1 Tax=Medicago truncatula TaxID=3880 RepID=A0A072VM05_MEDTR|nr:hypothetical protein MTR_1g069280 [Medicago truncatula]